MYAVVVFCSLVELRGVDVGPQSIFVFFFAPNAPRMSAASKRVFVLASHLVPRGDDCSAAAGDIDVDALCLDGVDQFGVSPDDDGADAVVGLMADSAPTFGLTAEPTAAVLKFIDPIPGLAPSGSLKGKTLFITYVVGKQPGEMPRSRCRCGWGVVIRRSCHRCFAPAFPHTTVHAVCRSWHLSRIHVLHGFANLRVNVSQE